CAQNGDRKGEAQPQLPPEWRVSIPPAPLTPQEELATFVLPTGFHAELVACEPLIEAPIAFSFDGDGKLWVVEMPSYMTDVRGSDELSPTGRIKVLSDTNGDGVFDHAEVFLDGLVAPRAVAPWTFGGTQQSNKTRGALVIEPPNLLYAIDTDGDGRADQTEVIAGGFDAALDNPEHAGNGLYFGLDGSFLLSQNAFSVRPNAERGFDLIPQLAHGQWGISQDSFGRVYCSPNSDPLLVDLVSRVSAARQPDLKGFEGVPARAANDMSVAPSHLTPGVNRGYQQGLLKDGRLASFTGACGTHIHEGPALTHGTPQAFVCEVTGNLVQRFDLTEKDGVPVATNADAPRSFLTSTDERFRPVWCGAGPDGALYIADLYRGIVQHRNFMTSFLRQQVEERRLTLPVSNGRIWRVVRDDFKPEAAPQLSTLDSAALAQLISTPEKGLRDQVRRELVARRDLTSVQPLQSILHNKVSALEVRIAALETLGAAGLVAPADIESASNGPPMLRVAALRVAEQQCADTAWFAPLLRRMAMDDNRFVRAQAVLAAAVLESDEDALEILTRALASDLEWRLMRSAVLSSLVDRENLMLTRIAEGALLSENSTGARALLAELCDLVLDGGSPQGTLAVLRLASASPQTRGWQTEVALERAALTQSLNNKTPTQLLLAAKPTDWDALLASADTIAMRAKACDQFLYWPGRNDLARVAPKFVLASQGSSAERGKRLFSNCMTCHQANGRGQPPVYPPLRGSPFALGEPGRLIRIVLHGLEGAVEVDGVRYNQAMQVPALSSDEDIAAVLTYMRSAWGNNAEPVDAAMVRQVREQTKGRARSWTVEELANEPVLVPASNSAATIGVTP
ncbi:MAG: c-type cytochrome, partial [Phycisphaerales bacterium]|nr:c-type cytochrome [Phycisphaerales bacterium]